MFPIMSTKQVEGSNPGPSLLEEPKMESSKAAKPIRTTWKRSVPLIILLIAIVLFYWYDDHLHASVYSLKACPFPSSEGFIASEYEDWLMCVRSKLSNKCNQRKYRAHKPSFCFPADQLEYKPYDPAAQKRPFVVSSSKCPLSFRKDQIYICNRAGINWSNKVQRNKRKLWQTYTTFDQFVHGDNTPKLLEITPNEISEEEIVVSSPVTPEPKDCENIRLKDFFPTMYELDTPDDVTTFKDVVMEKQQDPLLQEDRYIFKWSEDGFQGKGMEVKNLDESLELMGEFPFETSLMAQEYNKNPFLYNGKKFNLRTWAVIYNGDPLMVTFHDGYIAVAIADYYDHPPELSKAANIPNSWKSVVPKKDITMDLYHAAKTNFQTLSDYLDEDIEHRKIRNRNGTYEYLPENWLWDAAVPKMMDAMRYALKATMGPTGDVFQPKKWHKAGDKKEVEGTGWFDSTHISYVCYDFMIDDEANIWMHEENHGCGLVYDYFPKDSLPKWAYDLFDSLQAQSLAIAEEIFYRKKIGAPYSFDDLITPMRNHIPLVDHTSQIDIPREERNYCS